MPATPRAPTPLLQPRTLFRATSPPVPSASGPSVRPKERPPLSARAAQYYKEAEAGRVERTRVRQEQAEARHGRWERRADDLPPPIIPAGVDRRTTYQLPAPAFTDRRTTFQVPVPDPHLGHPGAGLRSDVGTVPDPPAPHALMGRILDAPEGTIYEPTAAEDLRQQGRSQFIPRT